jgi:predicted DNA-binding protein (UPF0278 family)
MTEEEKATPVEEKVETDDIFEELEEEEQRELDKIAEEAIKEAQKKKQELEEFAKNVTLAEIVECMEKIKKFLDLYREAMRTSEVLRDMLADEKEDPSRAFLKMFMGRGF